MEGVFSDVQVIETVQIARDGKVEKVYRVSAITAGGTAFTVKIGEKDFTQAAVSKALSDRAKLIDGITKL